MMRFLEFIIAVLIVIALFVLIGVFLPSSRTVSHSIETNRPVRQVYDTISGFQRFRDWHPIRAHDPGASYEVEGPRTGEGARLEYQSSNPQVGQGSYEIVEAQQDERIVLEERNDAYGDDKTHTFEIEEATSGKTVTVTWTYEVDYGWNLLGRYAGLYVNRNVGDDIKRGLAHLASLFATMPNFDYSRLPIDLTQVQPANLLYVDTSAERNISAVQNAMELALRDIRRVIEANDLEEAGPPRLITTNFGDETYDFDMAIPVRPAGSGEAQDEESQEGEDAEGADDAAAAEGEDGTAQQALSDEELDRMDEERQAAADADVCAQPLEPAPEMEEPELSNNVKFGRGYAGCALIGGYEGHPAALPLVRDMLRAYAAAHGYQIHDRAFEEYLTPLDELELGAAEFNVYWPVEHPANPAPPPQPAEDEDEAADGEDEDAEAAAGNDTGR